jgi:hypothetical protein
MIGLNKKGKRALLPLSSHIFLSPVKPVTLRIVEYFICSTFVNNCNIYSRWEEQ